MNAIQYPWVVIGCGVLFCLSGIYLFRRNVFEENRSITWPFIVLVMGIALVTLGSARLIFH